MVEVVAAVIRRGDQILICRRGPGGSCASLWEFPGGKRERGETPVEGLVRELWEELGVEAQVGALLYETTYRYPDVEVALSFYEAAILRGTPRNLVHNKLAWVLPGELKNYAFCPADQAFLCRLAGEEQP